MVLFLGIILFVLVMGILLYLESGFGIVLSMKFMELLSLNYLFLCRILLEVLGIYYYSVMVVNFFEVVCEVVGVNGVLVCVGVYYYDVGKIV